MATPWLGAGGSGHTARGDGYTDLWLMFRNPREIYVFTLLNDLDDSIRLTITGTLRNTCPRVSVEGHDYLQLQINHGFKCKTKK